MSTYAIVASASLLLWFAACWLAVTTPYVTTVVDYLVSWENDDNGYAHAFKKAWERGPVARILCVFATLLSIALTFYIVGVLGEVLQMLGYFIVAPFLIFS